MSPTTITHPDTFATEGWLISGDWFQYLLMTEAEAGLSLCKSADLQGSNNNVWIFWLIKFHFSIFISYILGRSQGIHLNRELRKHWSHVSRFLVPRECLSFNNFLLKLCTVSVPQECEGAICWWKHWMKWTKGKLVGQNDEGIFNLSAQYCQMVLHKK